MDLPGPPGAEGYEDSVIEVAKKPIADSTKAEKEFLEHLNTLKIRLENGELRNMLERCSRDPGGKWIYLCYPCAATCSGEAILQTHIAGKKHKAKLSMGTVWPVSIFKDHPFKNEKLPALKEAPKALEKSHERASEKPHDEVSIEKLASLPRDKFSDMFSKYLNTPCHLQPTLDAITTPLVGVEYLIEFFPEENHHEPSYTCILCNKQGHPRTIVHHLTSFGHRQIFLLRHFRTAYNLILPYSKHGHYREGVATVTTRLLQQIEKKFGRGKPMCMDRDEYKQVQEPFHKWIFQRAHAAESDNCTFADIVDVDLITSLQGARAEKDESPVRFNQIKTAGKNFRRPPSTESLSDISVEESSVSENTERKTKKMKTEIDISAYSPFEKKTSTKSSSHWAVKAAERKAKQPVNKYKMELLENRKKLAIESAKKTLAYHEKNPEKHPLYPEEWKKFWNRRYKEIQTEGKDPSKHDFKPEWIVFWTGRMKALHEEELKASLLEVYRRLNVTPPSSPERLQVERKSPKRSMERQRSPKRRSVDRRHSPPRRRSIERRISPRHRAPESRYSPRRRTPERQPHRREPPRDRRPSAQPRHRSPTKRVRTRSRSPYYNKNSREKSPRSLDGFARGVSPLSRRDAHLRNRSPRPPSSSLQTVLISDDDFKSDGNMSPWNSSLDSLGSLPDAKSPLTRPHTGSSTSRVSRSAKSGPDMGPTDNVVATLRLLAALEDYLGSMGPKIVELLIEALKMEKEEPNSSEQILERDDSLSLIEGGKEKLKGALQAGLVTGAAATAVKAAVVRTAALLHHADKCKSLKQKSGKSSGPAVAVAGVGSVDRAEIARQMAAALIAQGKQDVSAEELEQLVDAVVGMAEAKKKREAEDKSVKMQQDRVVILAPSKAGFTSSSSNSALEMLQSAYDEHDNKIEKEEAPDAMDGLSDGDLQTLLKNFNELSAEEQHNLIAYLKKLETREPRRVERLREYVSAAAAAAPPRRSPPPPDATAAAVHRIDSDDDDYTVEEVFKSVNQKVKEDQIRQEMEVVKKSLQEANSIEIISKESKERPKSQDNKLTSEQENNPYEKTTAANLLAMVQASVQSKYPINESINVQSDITHTTANTNSQLRSFGDSSEKAPVPPIVPPQIMNLLNLSSFQTFNEQETIELDSNEDQQNTNVEPYDNNEEMQQEPWNNDGDMEQNQWNNEMNENYESTDATPFDEQSAPSYEDHAYNDYENMTSHAENNYMDTNFNNASIPDNFNFQGGYGSQNPNTGFGMGQFNSNSHNNMMNDHFGMSSPFPGGPGGNAMPFAGNQPANFNNNRGGGYFGSHSGPRGTMRGGNTGQIPVMEGNKPRPMFGGGNLGISNTSYSGRGQHSGRGQNNFGNRNNSRGRNFSRGRGRGRQ